MTKSNLSKIRAAAGRKGGLRKAENTRKKQSLIANDATISIQSDLVNALQNLTAKIERLVNRLDSEGLPLSTNHKSQAPVKRTIKPVTEGEAKLNFWQNVAKENNVSGGAFQAILKENRELDSLFAKQKCSKCSKT